MMATPWSISSWEITSGGSRRRWWRGCRAQHVPALSLAMMPPMGRPPAMPLAKETRRAGCRTAGRRTGCRSGPRRSEPRPPAAASPFRAHSSTSLDIIPVQGQHAALALDQLHHDGAHIVPPGLPGRPVVGLGVAEALGEGEEVVVEHLLAGGRQGGDGAAVEGVVQGDDGGAALARTCRSCTFRASLIMPSLASPPPLAKNTPLMPVRWHRIWASRAARCRKQVGGVAQLQGLVRDGLDPVRVAVAQAGDADAAGEVDIGLALGAVQPGALPWSMATGKRP